MSIRKKFFDYEARREPKTRFYCAMCQKDMTEAATKICRIVHLIDGGSQVLHPLDEHVYIPDAGDCGLQLIGPDCAKKLGLEWSHK